MKRRPAQLRWVAVLALAGAMPLGCSKGAPPRPAPSSRIRIEAHKSPQALASGSGDLGRAVESVVDQVTPSVVQLVAAMPERSSHEPPKSLGGEPFTVMRAGPLGSGVVVGHNLVLTTGHVIEHAGDLRVRLSAGRELDATVIARDESHDLALLQVRGETLPLRPLALGASSPHAGEVVLAVGDLYGMGPSVTVGVVSNPPGDKASDTLETDAAINLTNTGGAIVNLRGELVGIANAKLTEERGMRGLSYATTAQVIQPLINGLRVGDQPLRDHEQALAASALRGVGTEDLDPGLREKFSISENLSHGAVVTSVDPHSPAARVGIEPGDVIVEVDFVPVLSSGMFAAASRADGPLLLLVVRGTHAAYVLVHP